MRQDPIRSYEEWQQSLKNFEWLSNEIPGATDIDMVLHAANPGGDDRFLVIETKKPGQPLPTGQRILLQGLHRQGWTVVLIHGPDDNDEFVLSWDWAGKVDKEALSTMVREWWRANKRGA